LSAFRTFLSFFLPGPFACFCAGAAAAGFSVLFAGFLPLCSAALRQRDEERERYE
jgi:hypothetical protein